MGKKKNEAAPDEYPGPGAAVHRADQAQENTKAPMTHYAFRCKNCGRLHTSADAGSAPTPSACRVCGKGVEFSPGGNKTINRDSWEVLGDAEDGRLDELGLKPEQVEIHRINHDRVRHENLARATEAYKALGEKEQRWKSKTPEEWIQAVTALRDRSDSLEERFNDPANDSATMAGLANEIAKVRDEIKDILALEWTERDTKHRAELQAAMDAEGHVGTRPARSVFAHGTERPGASDRG